MTKNPDRKKNVLEAVTRRCSLKNVFLKGSPNSQESTLRGKIYFFAPDFSDAQFNLPFRSGTQEKGVQNHSFFLIYFLILFFYLFHIDHCYFSITYANLSQQLQNQPTKKYFTGRITEITSREITG